jgi:hypothetical protein
MATYSVSGGSESMNVGFGIRSTAKLQAKGYVQVTGVANVRKFMIRMARDYRTYNKWMKMGANIVAMEGRRLAPIQSGRLAGKIEGRASARVTNKYGSKSTMIGGVVVANTPYGKSVSFGRYYPFGRYTIKRSKNGPPFQGIRYESIRSGNGNKYLKRAREASKPHVVALWNSLLRRYLQTEGYEYKVNS